MLKVTKMLAGKDNFNDDISSTLHSSIFGRSSNMKSILISVFALLCVTSTIAHPLHLREVVSSPLLMMAGADNPQGNSSEPDSNSTNPKPVELSELEVYRLKKDIDVLNYALALEHLESAFYQQVIVRSAIRSLW